MCSIFCHIYLILPFRATAAASVAENPCVPVNRSCPALKKKSPNGRQQQRLAVILVGGNLLSANRSQSVWDKRMAFAQPARLPQSVAHSFPFPANAKQCANGWQQARLAFISFDARGQSFWHTPLAPAQPARLPQSVAHSFSSSANAKQCSNGWRQPRLAVIALDGHRGQSFWHTPLTPAQPARLPQSVAHSFPVSANARQCANEWQQARLAFISFDGHRGQTVWHTPLSPAQPAWLPQSVAHSFPFSANAKQCANGWQHPRLTAFLVRWHGGQSFWHKLLAPAPARLLQSVAHSFPFPAKAKQCANGWQRARLAIR